MANAALERFVLKLSVPVFLFTFVLVFLLFGPSGPLAACLFFGYALAVLLFEATAALYGSFGKGRSLQTVFAVLFLLASFAVVLIAVWFTVRTGMELFWGLFAGLMSVPASLILYIVLESFGVTHTDFFT